MLSLFLKPGHSYIFQFDEKLFNKYVTEGDKSPPWFLMFGSSNCPACLLAEPEFETASSKSRGFARFAYCDTKVMQKTAGKLGIRAIPAFFLFTNDGVYQYSGASRTANSFVSFVAEKIGDGLEEADEAWVDAKEDQVILFTRRFKAPPIFAAAYGAFKNQGIRFGMARDTETLDLFGNPGMGNIWFYKNGEKTVYKGKADYGALIDAIAEHYNIQLDDEL